LQEARRKSLARYSKTVFSHAYLGEEHSMVGLARSATKLNGLFLLLCTYLAPAHLSQISLLSTSHLSKRVVAGLMSFDIPSKHCDGVQHCVWRDKSGKTATLSVIILECGGTARGERWMEGRAEGKAKKSSAVSNGTLDGLYRFKHSGAHRNFAESHQHAVECSHIS
jgi:hypothetical protein